MMSCTCADTSCSAKYPLAIIEKVLDAFGENVGIGYDIGCSFTATLQRSSLKNPVDKKNLRIVVNAFHGYAHNRSCQLSFHPLYVTGFGLEDLEICERVFASFNGLAVTTRYA